MHIFITHEGGGIAKSLTYSEGFGDAHKDIAAFSQTLRRNFPMQIVGEPYIRSQYGRAYDLISIVGEPENSEEKVDESFLWLSLFRAICDAAAAMNKEDPRTPPAIVWRVKPEIYWDEPQEGAPHGRAKVRCRFHFLTLRHLRDSIDHMIPATSQAA